MVRREFCPACSSLLPALASCMGVVLDARPLQAGAWFRGGGATGLAALAAGRVSPWRARHFSLFRQGKVPPRNATSLPVTPARRTHQGKLWFPCPVGSCPNSRFASVQTVTSPWAAGRCAPRHSQRGRWVKARCPDSQKSQPQPAQHAAPHPQMGVVVQPGRAARCILACPMLLQKR